MINFQPVRPEVLKAGAGKMACQEARHGPMRMFRESMSAGRLAAAHAPQASLSGPGFSISFVRRSSMSRRATISSSRSTLGRLNRMVNW